MLATPVLTEAEATSLYDAMMRPINDDLVSANIQASMKRRPNETDDEFELRMQDYDGAFFIFERALEDAESDENVEGSILASIRHNAKMQSSQSRDDMHLKSIEDQIS